METILSQQDDFFAFLPYQTIVIVVLDSCMTPQSRYCLVQVDVVHRLTSEQGVESGSEHPVIIFHSGELMNVLCVEITNTITNVLDHLL